MQLISPYTYVALGDKVYSHKRLVDAEMIKKAVCVSYGVTFDALMWRTRERRVREPRQVIAYLLCELTKMTLKEIGGYLGGQDHTTVIHSKGVVRDLIDTDPIFARNIELIRTKIAYYAAL